MLEFGKIIKLKLKLKHIIYLFVMCFGRLIITPDAYNPYLNDNLLPNIEKTTVTGTIINTFATLTFFEEFKTHKKDFYEIYINPPEGCVIYNIKT